MQYLVQAALLCCFFVTVKAEDSCPFFNDRLDDILTNKVRERLPDPLQIPAQLGDLTEEIVWGFSNITKLGNAQTSCKDGITSIKLTLTTYELKAPYSFTKDGKLASDKDGNVDLKCNDFQAKIEATFAKDENGKVRAKLQELQIEGMQQASLDSNGRGYPQHQTKAELTALFDDSTKRLQRWKKAVRDSVQEAIETELQALASDSDRETGDIHIAVGKAWRWEEDACLAIDNHLDVVIENVRESLPDPLQVSSSSSAVDKVWGLSDLSLSGKPEISCLGRTTFIKLTLTFPELKGRYKLTEDNKLFSDKDGDVHVMSKDIQAKVEATVVKDQDGHVRAELRRVLMYRKEEPKMDMSSRHSTSFTRAELQAISQDVKQRLMQMETGVQKLLKKAIETELREISMKAFVI